MELTFGVAVRWTGVCGFGADGEEMRSNPARCESALPAIHMRSSCGAAVWLFSTLRVAGY